MKKLLVVLLCLCMVFTMFACGGEDKPTGGHEKYEIQIAGGRSGDTWFVLSNALASFINERSDWLTCEVITTAGIADDVRLVAGDKSMWSNTLVCTMVPGNDVWGAEQGYLPKLIASMCFQSDCLLTLDSNMKLEDLDGKNLALPRDTPYGNGLVTRNFLDLMGIKYTFVGEGNGGRLTALQDGVCSAGVLVPDFYYPDTFVMGSGMLELSSRGTLYFPTQGRAEELLPIMAKACQTDPFVGEYELPAMVAIAPAGSFGAGQTAEVPFFAWPIYLAASDDVPADVIQEVCRIYYEAAKKGEFETYHAVGKGIVPEFAAFSPWEEGAQRDKFYSKAALDYYKSVGQEIKCFSDLQNQLLGK